MPVNKFGRMSDAKTKDTGISLTYINNNYIRSDGSTPVSGSIDMRGNTLYNLTDPVNPRDVAKKEYADKVGGGSPFLKENGNYQATHVINMAFKKLINLHKPTDTYDATTKDYVDYVKSFLNERLDKKNTYYCSKCKLSRTYIIYGKYQFSLGGNNKNGDENIGFLVPHSGRIIKIILKTPYDTNKLTSIRPNEDYYSP